MKKILIGILMILGSVTYGKEVEIPKNRMTEYPFVSFEKIRVSDYKEKPMEEVKITIETTVYERKNMYSDRISKGSLKEPFIFEQKINTITEKTREEFQTNKNGIAEINKKIEFGDLIKDLNYKGAFYSAKFDKKMIKMIIIVEKDGYTAKKYTYEGEYPNILDVRLKSQTDNDNNSKVLQEMTVEEQSDNLKIFKNLAKDNNLELKNYSEIEIRNKNYTAFDLDYKNNLGGTELEFNNYILPLLEYGEKLIHSDADGIMFRINEKNGNTYQYLIRNDILKKYKNYELSGTELYRRVIRIKNKKRLN
ncbi:hypothetical protein [Psychrilyobacter atlanticus]|uniref:hypothetical protein n=1 Tax=Psychrilyobacter atlanticus TaxID=271091 RepID=UPI000415BC96|nr:hypothetical protein [Psychrilyobacter atlanticus]